MSRRVVVTGVGLVSSLGIGTEETWQAIREGRPGISRIEQFDATDFASRIAGEVKNFDPARYIERKEIKKMGRFIQFGIAATEFALAQSGLKIDAHNAERAGVFIGSGIGGFEVIEREHKILLEKGPSRISPFFIPATIINLASGYVSIRTGAKGPEFGHRHGVHVQRAFHRRFLQDHPAQRRGRDDLRRRRGCHYAHERRRIRRHARPFAAQR